MRGAALFGTPPDVSPLPEPASRSETVGGASFAEQWLWPSSSFTGSTCTCVSYQYSHCCTAVLLCTGYYSILPRTSYTRTCCQSEGTDPLCPNVQLPGGPGRVIAGSKTPLPRVPAPAAGLSSGRSTARHQTCRLTLCLPGFCELWAPRMLAEYHSFLSRAGGTICIPASS